MMDSSTKQILMSLAAGAVRKTVLGLGAAAVAHGYMTGNSTEILASAAVTAIPVVWSFVGDYLKPIALAQLEVLKAKSLAQAAKLRQASLPPVTVQEISDQSKMSSKEVASVIAKLPVAVQNNVAAI